MTTQKEQHLLNLLKTDALYQSLLTQCLQAEERYHTICQALCEEDRLSIERYICLCEEMDHRKLQLALSEPDDQ